MIYHHDSLWSSSSSALSWIIFFYECIYFYECGVPDSFMNLFLILILVQFSSSRYCKLPDSMRFCSVDMIWRRQQKQNMLCKMPTYGRSHAIQIQFEFQSPIMGQIAARISISKDCGKLSHKSQQSIICCIKFLMITATGLRFYTIDQELRRWGKLFRSTNSDLHEETCFSFLK